MRLSELEIGVSADVVNVHGIDGVSKRLMEMGVVPGVKISMIKTAPFGDPIEVRVRGYNLALRKQEASAIEVTV